MTSKQWLLSFVLTALALVLLLATFNVLTDPFGVFGDVLFEWHSYNETNNPRTAKIGYLREHFDDYDSYIIGCSASSSFPVETWNRYLDADFYNLFVYGADMKDTEQFAAYLLEHDAVKNLVLCLELGDGAVYDTESNPYTHSMLPAVDGSFPLPFYLRFLFANPAYGGAKIRSLREDTWLAQSFDVFDEETGAYDKKKHALHPNYADKSCPTNAPLLNEGIVLKFNGNLKYTTDGLTAAVVDQICKKAGVPYQTFIDRSDLQGGYTLGHISETQVSLNSADIGLPQLAMHSPYETAGVKDVEYMVKTLQTFFQSSVVETGYGEYEVMTE